MRTLPCPRILTPALGIYFARTSMYWYGSVSSSTIRSRAARTSAVDRRFVDSGIFRRAGSAAPRLPVHDTDEPVGLERPGEVLKERDAIFDFLVRIDDDDRVEACDGEIRVASLSARSLDVLQPFALDAPLDRLEHLALHVLRVDDAIGADASRQMNREPARACADVGDLRSVGDVQHVHDLFRLLPCGAVGAFEESEIDRWKQAAVAW